jgi:hypothetical protein
MALTKAKREAKLRRIETNIRRAQERDWVENPEKDCRNCLTRFRLSCPRAALPDCGHALYCFNCYTEAFGQVRPRCPTCGLELFQPPLKLFLLG